MTERIRVLVVDDSALMRKLIPAILARDSSIEVVGTAMDGAFALKKIEELQPDVVTLDLVNQRVAPCPIEPRALLAQYDEASDRITIRASSQMPAGFRDTLAQDVLGIASDKVRVLVGDVGGGFGMKTGLYPEDAVVAWCARQFRRPIKWRADRIDGNAG